MQELRRQSTEWRTAGIIYGADEAGTAVRSLQLTKGAPRCRFCAQHSHGDAQRWCMWRQASAKELSFWPHRFRAAYDALAKHKHVLVRTLPPARDSKYAAWLRTNREVHANTVAAMQSCALQRCMTAALQQRIRIITNDYQLCLTGRRITGVLGRAFVSVTMRARAISACVSCHRYGHGCGAARGRLCTPSGLKFACARGPCDAGAVL